MYKAKPREKASVLTKEDRERNEKKKRMKEGKSVEQYNDIILEYVVMNYKRITLCRYMARKDPYEALVALQEMMTTHELVPDGDTYCIFFVVEQVNM